MAGRHRIHPRTLEALLLVLGLILVPHVLRLPFWVTGTVVALGLWRLGVARRGWPLPGRWWRRVLTVGLVAGVGLSYGTIMGLEAGLGVICVMGALKLTELQSHRDAIVLILLGFFLVAAQLLFDQSMASGAYLFAGAWGLTAVLIAVHRSGGESRPWTHGGLAGALVAQAIPMAAVLFVLFPRVDGPLLGSPGGGSARTGLDDHMDPGAISRLSRSGEVAFRVTFEDGPPSRSRRYWRGPVLTRYDGRAWQAPERRSGSGARARNTGRAVAYRVMLEPHHRHWLFALDLPGSPPPEGRLDRTLTPLAESRVRQLRGYEMRSFPDFRLEPRLSPEYRERYRALPESGHPQARDLARGWAEGADSPAAVVEKGLEFFREGGFRYTLTPPQSPGQDWIDGFLFDTRAGFCGHFAGSFAFMMRAAGVPARVVTGYLGGEMPPGEDYMVVRQSDAHAWTEVWLPERGWRRVDPTVTVSPARLEEGLAEAVPNAESVPEMARSDGGWWQGFRWQLDALVTAWNRWVLAYGPGQQRQLLQRLGLERWPEMVTLLAGALGVAGGSVALWVLARRRPWPDPPARLYARFERKLARAGLSRAPTEGPEAFGERAAAVFPQQAHTIRAVTAAYNRLRYGVGEDPATLAQLRRWIARLRLPRGTSSREVDSS